MENINELAQVIKQHWHLFVAALIITAPIAWSILNWRFKTKIEKLKENISDLEHQLKILKSTAPPTDICVGFTHEVQTEQPRVISEIIELTKTSGAINLNEEISFIGDASAFYSAINKKIDSCRALIIVVGTTMGPTISALDGTILESICECGFFKGVEIYLFAQKILNDSPAADSDTEMTKVSRLCNMSQVGRGAGGPRMYTDDVGLLSEFQNTLLRLGDQRTRDIL